MQEDRKLKSEFCQASVELNNAKDHLNEEIEDLDEDQSDFDKASEILNSFNPPSLSKFWEIFWLFILGSAELLMNYKIFSILGSSARETWIYAIGLGAAFPLLAYFIGSKIKKEKLILKEKIFIILAFFIVFVGLFAVMVLRSTLFEFINQNQVIHFNISPTQMSFMFIGLNLLLFFVALIITYNASHSKPQEYKKALTAYKLAKLNLEQSNEDYKEAIDRYELAKMKYETLKQKRLKRHEYFHSSAVDIIENTEWYISVYRTANIKNRKDGIVPPCFKQDNHDLVIPNSLIAENLDWKCTDFEQNIN